MLVRRHQGGVEVDLKRRLWGAFETSLSGMLAVGFCHLVWVHDRRAMPHPPPFLRFVCDHLGPLLFNVIAVGAWPLRLHPGLKSNEGSFAILTPFSHFPPSANFFCDSPCARTCGARSEFQWPGGAAGRGQPASQA